MPQRYDAKILCPAESLRFFMLPARYGLFGTVMDKLGKRGAENPCRYAHSDSIASGPPASCPMELSFRGCRESTCSAN